MSTQRRRVLADTKMHDGVYIEGLDGKAYTVDNWQGGSAANSVIVASGDVKFRIALIRPPYQMTISLEYDCPFENYMTAISDYAAAQNDYNGSGNTANILKVDSSTDCAAGYCNAFIFPDGKTKGCLPSFGQLKLVHKNKTAVNAALNKCGGVAMVETYYWSSTFFGASGNYRYFWIINWNSGGYDYVEKDSVYYVRPFADLT